jgi:pyruvate-ferredoxin/flavodoxin oxidoreductase
MLRDIAGIKPEKEEEVDIESKVRAEVVGKIAQGLMQLAGGEGEGIMELATAEAAPAPSANGKGQQDTSAEGGYMAPWIETDECTSCDECIKLNPKIFEYNEDKKAYIKNPDGGPYSDLVKAAEKCTARVIHPGLPADHSEKDIEKWIKRGEKYN